VDLLRKGREEFGREPAAARRLVATGQAPVASDLPRRTSRPGPRLPGRS